MGWLGQVARLGAVAAFAAACAPRAEQTRDASLTAALRDTPPATDEPGCWHGETLPALFETVTEQRIAPGGQVVQDQRQVLLRDRRAVWFAVPCDPPTANATATLQRALKARGLYDAPVTGVLDEPTRAAVRRYQAARGLDSGTLSLAAAVALGLVVAPRG